MTRLSPRLLLWSLLVISLLARVGVLLDLRLYPTGDQGAYLQCVEWILGVTIPGIEVFHDRLPGFPVFLAPLLALFGFNAWVVLIAQAVLGTANGLLAWHLARQLGARPLPAWCAGLFVGIQPLYLFFEHLMMAETLALFLTLAGLALLFEARVRGSMFWWALAGVVLSASVVTRSNGLLFAGIVALGFAWLPAAGRRWQRVGIVACGLASLIVPWVVRNYQAEGRWVLAANVPTARLVYWIHQGLFDPARPSGRQILALGYRSETPKSLFRALKSLDPQRLDREARVQALLADQMAGRQAEYLRAALRSAAAFVGGRPGLSPTRNWLFQNLGDQAALTRLEDAAGLPPKRLVHARGSRLSWRTALLRRAGLLYLDYGRFVLVLAGLGVLGVTLRRRLPIELILVAGYLATAFLHAGMLADHDRFTTMWDWLVVLLAVRLLVRAPAAALPDP
jgi:4-amino-4-deoxy-L-arabinose transferase-like glycosyltransferase